MQTSRRAGEGGVARPTRRMCDVAKQSNVTHAKNHTYAVWSLRRLPESMPLLFILFSDRKPFLLLKRKELGK